jgi:hypothetical protein
MLWATDIVAKGNREADHAMKMPLNSDVKVKLSL